MGDIYMPDERVVLEPSHRRVRTYLNGQAVAESKAMLLLREPGNIPVYYFPREDVRMELLEPGDHQERSSFKGEGTFWHVVVAGQRAENAAFTFHDPHVLAGGRPSPIPAIRNGARVCWKRPVGRTCSFPRPAPMSNPSTITSPSKYWKNSARTSAPDAL